MEQSSSFFNISHFSMAKRMHRTKIRRQDCGKIKAHGEEPDINCLDKFRINEPSDCVKKTWDTQSIYRETRREGKKKFKPEAASSSSRKAERCILWQVDGCSSGAKPAATDKSQESWDFLTLNHGAITKNVSGKLGADSSMLASPLYTEVSGET